MATTSDSSVSDYLKTPRRGKMNPWVLDRKLKRLERLQKMNCNYERVLAAAGSQLHCTDETSNNVEAPSAICQKMMSNREKRTQEQRAGTSSICSRSLLKRVQTSRATTKTLRFQKNTSQSENAEEHRPCSEEQIKLKDRLEANAEADASMIFRRCSIGSLYYPQKGLLDDMSAITTPSTFDASIFAETLASTSSLEAEEKAQAGSAHVGGVQVEFEKAERLLSEVIQEIELLDNGNDENSSYGDRKSNTDFNGGASATLSSVNDCTSDSTSESSQDLRYIKCSFDMSTTDSGLLRNTEEVASLAEGSVGRVKGKDCDGSVTELTVATTNGGSFDEDPSASESESSSASPRSKDEDAAECQTANYEGAEEDQRTSKMIQDMKLQVTTLQRESNVTEKTAQVFLDGYKTSVEMLEEENEMLEDDRNTLYEELKDLLLQENMEAKRLQQQLSVLKKSQYTLKQWLGAAALFISLALAIYLQAQASQLEGLCSPARPGTRFVDIADAEHVLEDNTQVVGEAPWWIPDEYGWLKQPAYDIIGCPSPRTQIEVKRGMLWITQPSTGRVLLKKPSTATYVRGDTLHILDQRLGRHQEIQAPWAAPADQDFHG